MERLIDMDERMEIEKDKLDNERELFGLDHGKESLVYVIAISAEKNWIYTSKKRRGLWDDNKCKIEWCVDDGLGINDPLYIDQSKSIYFVDKLKLVSLNLESNILKCEMILPGENFRVLDNRMNSFLLKRMANYCKVTEYVVVNKNSSSIGLLSIPSQGYLMPYSPIPGRIANLVNMFGYRVWDIRDDEVWRISKYHYFYGFVNISDLSMRSFMVPKGFKVIEIMAERWYSEPGKPIESFTYIFGNCEGGKFMYLRAILSNGDFTNEICESEVITCEDDWKLERVVFTRILDGSLLLLVMSSLTEINQVRVCKIGPKGISLISKIPLSDTCPIFSLHSQYKAEINEIQIGVFPTKRGMPVIYKVGDKGAEIKIRFPDKPISSYNYDPCVARFISRVISEANLLDFGKINTLVSSKLKVPIESNKMGIIHLDYEVVRGYIMEEFCEEYCRGREDMSIFTIPPEHEINIIVIDRLLKRHGKLQSDESFLKMFVSEMDGEGELTRIYISLFKTLIYTKSEFASIYLAFVILGLVDI